MRRVVLDTNTVVSALLWGGTPRRILIAAEDGLAELFTSQPLLTELERILHRPKFDRKLGQLRFTVADAMEAYLAVATPVRSRQVARTSPDPDDDEVLGTALAANADLIVSGDQHLLSLGAFRAIPILNTAAAVAHLRSASTSFTPHPER